MVIYVYKRWRGFPLPLFAILGLEPLFCRFLGLGWAAMRSFSMVASRSLICTTWAAAVASAVAARVSAACVRLLASGCGGLPPAHALTVFVVAKFGVCGLIVSAPSPSLRQHKKTSHRPDSGLRTP